MQLLMTGHHGFLSFQTAMATGQVLFQRFYYSSKLIELVTSVEQSEND